MIKVFWNGVWVDVRAFDVKKYFFVVLCTLSEKHTIVPDKEKQLRSEEHSSKQHKQLNVKIA
jgi:hypothetical protein